MLLKYPGLIVRLTLEDKVALCSGADFWSTKAFESCGIPTIFMADGPHGLRKQAGGGNQPGAHPSLPATCFPTASATACSWDRALLQALGEALAEEALQEGVSILLGPGANIQRSPLCGRNFEYFSEDPYLAGELATAWIHGVQSKGVGAAIKHFAGNNQETLRMISDSLIDERTLREIYLPAFEKAVKDAQPAMVMCAYNQLNGTYCSDHTSLLRDILREEWGFAGVLVTDWGAMHDRVQAFKAGLDLEMPGSSGYFDPAVIEAVKNGALPEARIDESVDRLINLIFSAAENSLQNHRYDVQAHHQLAQKIAAQSAVLLKNQDQILPLHNGQCIAVIGAFAQVPRYQGAGSSLINPTRLSSTLDGLNELGVSYTYYPGYERSGAPNLVLLRQALQGAKDCQVAVVFAGLTEAQESEGFDRLDLHLLPAHNELIEQVAAANPNTVVVLAGGAPVEMHWLSRVKAVLHMGLAGQAGGLAAAELLMGAASPSGKLAQSYPLCYEDLPLAGYYKEGSRQAQYREAIYVGYRYFDKAQQPVCFPFGHGLSYTTFAYRNLVLSRTEMQAGEDLTVTVTVQNTGAVSGAEIVQLYVSSLQQPEFRPEKELKEFDKVFLQAGEEKQLTFHLNFRSFACYDCEAKTWIVPEGVYAISIAASSRDIWLQGQVVMHGTRRQGDPARFPKWYTHPSGKVTETDFERLLGRRIEKSPKPQKGGYTLNSTLRDMQASPVIRVVMRSIEQSIARDYGGANEDNPNFRMSVEASVNMPLQNLVAMSSGQLPGHIAQGLVHLANGHIWRGLKSLLGFR